VSYNVKNGFFLRQSVLLYLGFLGYQTLTHFSQRRTYAVAASFYSSVAANQRRYDVTFITFKALWTLTCRLLERESPHFQRRRSFVF